MPNNSENCSITANEITAKQARTIGALLSSRTIGAAAKSARISERQIYNWMQDDNFRAALCQAESELINAAVRRLAHGISAALDSLETLTTKAKHENVKRQACVDLLALFLKFNEAHAINERLTVLENRLGVK